MCVRIGWSTEDDDRISAVQIIKRIRRSRLNCISPSPTRHSCCFTRRNNNEKLSHTEHLNIDNVRRPIVRLGGLSNIEQNRFDSLALFLRVVRCMQQITNNSPKRIGIRVSWLSLLEVE